MKRGAASKLQPPGFCDSNRRSPSTSNLSSKADPEKGGSQTIGISSVGIETHLLLQREKTNIRNGRTIYVAWPIFSYQ